MAGPTHPTPDQSHLPLAFRTDYEGLRGVKVKSAYMYSSEPPVDVGRVRLKDHGPVSAHTWIVFETEDNKLILARGGAMNEPRESAFGKEIGKRFVAAEGNQTLGMLTATVAYMAEKRGGEAKRSEKEDTTIERKSGVLDTVNYTDIEQGIGVAGLKPRAGVRSALITDKREDAQRLFESSLEVAAHVTEAAPEYRLMPGPVMDALTMTTRNTKVDIGWNKDGDELRGNSGVNSHSVFSWILRDADDKAENTTFIKAADQFLAYKIAPGSSVSGVTVVGRGPQRVGDVLGASYRDVLAKGHKSPPDALMNYAKPGDTSSAAPTQGTAVQYASAEAPPTAPATEPAPVQAKPAQAPTPPAPATVAASQPARQTLDVLRTAAQAGKLKLGEKFDPKSDDGKAVLALREKLNAAAKAKTPKIKDADLLPTDVKTGTVALGPKTIAQIKAIQKAAKLSETGHVDDKTLSAIEKAGEKAKTAPAKGTPAAKPDAKETRPPRRADIPTAQMSA